jgi:hypothetical protein
LSLLREAWNKSHMSEPMGECLFGDSTPAPLKADFLVFLREMVDFAAEALKAQGQASDTMRSSALLSDATERAIAQVEVVVAAVTRTLEHADPAGCDPVVASTVAKIRSATWDVARAETSAARAVAATEAARAAQIGARARGVCEQALATLLVRHEPPSAVSVVKLGVEGGGAHYDARSHGQTSYGLSWDAGLGIPAEHPLARVLRIDRVVERLEIAVPEETAWPHKGIKVKPQRLDRLYLAELVLTPAEMFLKLRAAPDGTGAGCNLWLPRNTSAARFERVVATGAAPDSPFDVEGEDGEKLRLLCDRLAAMTGEIAQNRQLPIAARIDDRPIHEHEASVVVERLVANVAAQVDEIAKRSLAAGELVLRRRLGDDRREEVFLSKAELLAKLEVVPPALRSLFDPLKLGTLEEEASPDTVLEPLGPNTVRRPVDDEPTVIVEDSVTDWQPDSEPSGLRASAAVAPSPARFVAHRP